MTFPPTETIGEKLKGRLLKGSFDKACALTCRVLCRSPPHPPTPFPLFPYFPKEIGDRKGTTKKLCDKDFAERSGELSGAICLKTLVLLGNDP